MTIIPQCMYCKYAMIKEQSIICNKYKNIPQSIREGNKKCEYYKKPIK